MADLDWLKYANQGATRNQPLNEELVQQLATFLPELGLQMEVFSGGQPATGLARIGSHRHDHGKAADVFFRQGDRRLDWANEADLPIFQEIVRRGRAAGITGWGAGEGYMQPGSMHLGGGPPSVWGAGGRGRNAPQWLIDAYHGGGDAPKQYALDTSGYAQDAAPAPADGPKGAEAYPAPAPPLPPPYDVADRPIGAMQPTQVAGVAAPKPKGGKLAGKIGDALAGFGTTAFGGGGGGMAPRGAMATPGAARLDAPGEQPTIDPQQAEVQRQQLAMALARLNSGRLA